MLTPTVRDQDDIRYSRQPGQSALLIDATGLAKMLDRSLTAIRRDDKAGRIPKPITLGGARKWRVAEIEQWVQASCPRRSAWEATYRPSRSGRAG
jgi:predicted DNA-binding transcriptional regulator AlpA